MRLRAIAGRRHNTWKRAGREFMNSSKIGACLGLCLAWAPLLHAAGNGVFGSSGAGLELQIPATPPPSLNPYRTLLDRYCAGCHNRQLKTAGVELDDLDLTRVGDDAPVWEKVVRQLRTGVMPPQGMPRPPAEDRSAFSSWLESALDRAAEANPDPGRPASYRLTRTQYANAIRDLLALEVDGPSLLPPDDPAFGFDNVADSLSFSPLLLERYLSAARKISRLAVGDPTMQPAAATYTTSPLAVQSGRMSEELPFGSGGGLAIRHRFPLDGEYVMTISLQRRRTSRTRQLDVRLDGKRLRLIRLDGQDGRSAYGQPASPDLTVRFPAGAGARTVGVSFLGRAPAPEGMGPARLPVGSLRGGFSDWGVRSVRIDGPFRVQGPGDTPSRRQIFICRPLSVEESDELDCARRILANLARRAFRRPVTNSDIDPLLEFYRQGRSRGNFDAGIQSALERILVDPEFLFRVERDPPAAAPSAAFNLGDLDLASRLSFFLWSSAPDEVLLEAAIAGKLNDPPVLEDQVRRMLADPRSGTLVTNFATQWLHLRNLRAVTPDENRHPEWDDNLREALRRETELFLQSQLVRDRSVTELLDAGYTFVNERLARHYGIPHVYGTRFRRVDLDDERRRGLLGQASVLTVTSYATRTSPVLRGKWLLENILGTKVPPPPADVPELPDHGEAARPASLRQRMEQHSSNPACSSCHRLMDPLGFALENFDAIGRWRDRGQDGVPIDPLATLPDGTTIHGPADLRSLILSRRREFVENLTGKLLTFAVGRGVEHYDMPAIREIMRQAAPSNYRWSALILGIVKSRPFRMKRSAP